MGNHEIGGVAISVKMDFGKDCHRTSDSHNVMINETPTRKYQIMCTSASHIRAPT